MLLLDEAKIDCPYCGEKIEVLLNHEDIDQEYIEDCQVCCKPIVFSLARDTDGDLGVFTRAENDTL